MKYHVVPEFRDLLGTVRYGIVYRAIYRSVYIYIYRPVTSNLCTGLLMDRYERYYSKLNTLILPTFLGFKLMWQLKTCNIFHDLGRLCMIYVWQIFIWEAMLNFRTQKYQMDNNWIPRAWCTSWKLVPKLHLVMCWHLEQGLHGSCRYLFWHDKVLFVWAFADWQGNHWDC